MQWGSSEEESSRACFDRSHGFRSCFLGCDQLLKLPSLHTVKSLQLIGCASLAAISDEDISPLTSLQSLYLIGCHALSSLPDGLTGLASLQMVCLVGLRSLSALPGGLEGQLEMRSLDIGWTNVGIAGLSGAQLGDGMVGPSLRWCCYLTKPAGAAAQPLPPVVPAALPPPLLVPPPAALLGAFPVGHAPPPVLTPPPVALPGAHPAGLPPPLLVLPPGALPGGVPAALPAHLPAPLPAMGWAGRRPSRRVLGFLAVGMAAAAVTGLAFGIAKVSCFLHCPPPPPREACLNDCQLLVFPLHFTLTLEQVDQCPAVRSTLAVSALLLCVCNEIRSLEK